PEELKLQNYWRTIQVPGVIIDHPGLSDRGVPAPVAGIVTRLHTQVGLAVKPGDPLFTIRVNSEYLQNAQAELFKAASEMILNRTQRNRLSEGDIVPQAKLIDLDQQHSRLEVIARAHRQDLVSRGLTPEQIADVEKGHLLREMQVFAPAPLPGQKPL